MRGRALGIATILLLAPVTAELLQAYLGDLGGPVGLIFVVLFFAPMYGGIALLIREVSVRTGRGWRGRLLLAAGFGTAMPTIIDVSLFTPVRDDIDGWDTILEACSVGGIGWYAVVTWVGGHVLMSVSAPIVIGETLARRPGPWLRTSGLVVIPIGFVAVAWFIHRDQVTGYAPEASSTDYAVSGIIVALVVALAFTPLGRPMSARPEGRTPAPLWCGLLGLVAMACFDLAPLSWAGVAMTIAVAVGGLTLVSRWSRSPGWSPRHLAALTFGAVLTRTLIGFFSPLPQDTTWAEKIGQNLTYLVLVLLLGWALSRRSREVRMTQPVA